MNKTIKKGLYFVAVKALIINSNSHLLITKDIFDAWDIPGGRLADNDFTTPLESVLNKKIIEELGSDFKYRLDKPVIFFRHERDEKLDDNHTEKRRIFALGYEGKYIGGEIKLGNNHSEFKWVDLKSFKADDYFTDGWLRGIKEYQKLNQ